MKPFIIQYGHPYCKLVEGDYAEIRDAVSVEDPTAKFKRARVPPYIAARIPDRVVFYDYAERLFPVGLLPDVQAALRAKGIVSKVVGKPDYIGNLPLKGLHGDMLFGKSMSGKRAYQLEAAKAAIKAERGVLWLATNCLHKDKKLTVSIVYPQTGRRARRCCQKTMTIEDFTRKLNSRTSDTHRPYAIVRKGPDNGWRNHWFARPWHDSWDICVLQRAPDGSLREAKVKRAWSSGVQRVYKLTIVEGPTIRATLDHRFLTRDGWKPLREVGIGEEVCYRFAGRTDFGPVQSILPDGVEETYDIEMEDPENPNFIADDVVVHNSGKTTVLAAMAKHLHNVLGGRGGILVPNSGLLHQTAKELREMLGRSPSVGRIGNGLRELADISVSTAQTAVHGTRGSKHFNAKLHKWLRDLTFLFIDENHHSSSDTWRKILSTTKARVIIGVTGTHHSGDAVKDFTVKAFVGGVIMRVTNEDLAVHGISARVYTFCVTDPSLYTTDYTADKWVRSKKTGKVIVDEDGKPIRKDPGLRQQEEQEYIHDPSLILSIGRIAASFNQGGHKPCIISSRLTQIRLIEEACKKRGLHPYVVEGATEGSNRSKIVRKYARDPLGVLIASTVFDEGFNVKEMGCLILASLGKSNRQVCQRIGRALRAKDGDVNAVAVVDFIPNNGDYLAKHSLERVSIYKREKFRVVNVKDVKAFCANAAKGGWEPLIGTARYNAERAKAKAHKK